MHRHRAGAIPSRISASVGFGFRSNRALAVMICPFWQKPHCGTCSSIHACCTGSSLPSFASPSSVVISPLTRDATVIHDRVATPPMITVQAPHWPSPHPNLGPRNLRSFRRTYSRRVDGSTSTVCSVPFTFNVIALIASCSSAENSILPTDHHAQHYEGSEAQSTLGLLVVPWVICKTPVPCTPPL